MITPLDEQRSRLLFGLLALAAVATPLSEIIVRVGGSSLPVIALQAFVLISVIALAPLKRQASAVEALFALVFASAILMFLVRDIMTLGTLSVDAIGNTLRSLAFAKLLVAQRAFVLTRAQLEKLAIWILLSCSFAVLVIRLSGISGSIRIEPVILTYGFGLYLVKTTPRQGIGLAFSVASLLLLVVSQKASLLLAAVGVTAVMFPVFTLIGLSFGLVGLPFVLGLLETLVQSDALGRFTTRVRLLQDLTFGFDRDLLAVVTSNRSEEYFYLIDQWRSTGFPVFGAGLSSTVLLETAEIERSTFHNLYMNLIRIFGAVSLFFFVGLGVLIARAFQLSYMAVAIVFGLLLHNLLTYALLHSPAFYLLILFAPALAREPDPEGVRSQSAPVGRTPMKGPAEGPATK